MTAGATTVGLTTFANNPNTTAASTSGESSPAAGTQESWTVTSGASFPNASSSSVPTQGYHIADPAQPTEIILVTDNGSSGTSWTVTRGVEGTTPVAHAGGATYYQVVSADDLTSMKQASGAITNFSSPLTNSTTETLVAVYYPATNEISAGTTFECIATGLFRCGGTTSPILTWQLRWGWQSSSTPGTSLLKLATGTGCPNLSSASQSFTAGVPFELQATLTFVSTTSAAGNFNFWYQPSTTTAVGVSSVSSNGVAITGLTAPPGGGPLALTATWGNTGTTNALSIPAPLSFRVA